MEKHAKQYPVDAVLFTDDDGKAIQENSTDETKEEDPPTNFTELKKPEVVSVAVNTEEKTFVCNSVQVSEANFNLFPSDISSDDDLEASMIETAGDSIVNPIWID